MQTNLLFRIFRHGQKMYVHKYGVINSINSYKKIPKSMQNICNYLTRFDYSIKIKIIKPNVKIIIKKNNKYDTLQKQLFVFLQLFLNINDLINIKVII